MDDVDFEALDPKTVRAFLLGVIIAAWLFMLLSGPPVPRIVLLAPWRTDSDDDTPE